MQFPIVFFESTTGTPLLGYDTNICISEGLESGQLQCSDIARKLTSAPSKCGIVVADPFPHTLPGVFTLFLSILTLPLFSKHLLRLVFASSAGARTSFWGPKSG